MSTNWRKENSNMSKLRLAVINEITGDVIDLYDLEDWIGSNLEKSMARAMLSGDLIEAIQSAGILNETNEES